ncbi:MAG: hypothetical protein HY958_09405 [Bacteroidia bacterium]|nr:hypothetical protein [Bacteroidia bacterium]
MKKVFFTVFMMGMMIYTQAQNTGTSTTTTSASTSGNPAGCLTSKKGCIVLPESGDWALGINAIPFLDYAGTLFNGHISPTFSFIDGTNAIYGKYFIDEKTAYRGKVRIGVNNTKNIEFVDIIPPTGIPPVQVQDVQNVFSTNIVLGGGIEKHKGKSRIQGFYGGEGLLIFSSSKTAYSYGNALSPINPVQQNVFNPAMDGVITNKSGMTFGIGARAFIGVEYFFAPKVCIGGEFGWGIAFLATGKGEQAHEEWNTAGGDVWKYTTETGGGYVLDMDTDNFNGSIYLLFHF